MNIAIIDDNATDRILLSSFLKRYLKENDILNSATINEFESGEDFFASYTSNFFQIVFIDCYMFGISGMEVAKKLRHEADNCAIFFTTSTSEFAVESFLVKASGYLLKPYKYEDFCKSVNLCDTVKLFVSNPFVEYPDGKNTLRIFISDIIYGNTNGHYIHLASKSRGDLRFRCNFDTFSTPLLKYQQFLVCCRGHLINMDYVKEIEDCDFIMKDNSHVPMTKKSKNEIKEMYKNYLFSKMALG